MDYIIKLFEHGSNQWLNVLLLLIAFGRIYLEIIQFEFQKLPITKMMFSDSASALKFHRTGLYICVGYIALWAPAILFSSGN